jgi:hypothetical protein
MSSRIMWHTPQPLNVAYASKTDLSTQMTGFCSTKSFCVSISFMKMNGTR